MRHPLLFVAALCCGCGGAAPSQVVQPAPPRPTKSTIEVPPVLPESTQEIAGAGSLTQVPLELKGDRIGEMTLDQFTEKYAGKGVREIRQTPQEIATQSQRIDLMGTDKDPLTFATQEVSFMRYQFMAGRLEKLTIECKGPPSDIARALTEKYGPPRVHTNGGQQRHEWITPAWRLVVYGQGMVVGTDIALQAQREAAEKEAAKKDL